MSTYIDLILNLTLLIAISGVSGFIGQRWPRQSRLVDVLQGLLFGAAAFLGMLRPGIIAPGLIFDGRSVVVSLCALFFGPVAAAVAVVTASAGRVALGGEGTVTGVLVIVTSAAIGVLAHQRRRSIAAAPTVKELYIFGIVVHVAMLAMMLTLPGGSRAVVLGQFSVPILLTFPVATILAGKILADQQAAVRFLDALQRTRTDLDITLRSIGDAVASADADGRIVRMNPVAETLTGWPEAEARGNAIGDVFRIETADGRRAGDLVAGAMRAPQARGLIGDVLLTSRDGTRRPIAGSAAPIRDDNGQMRGVVVVFSDQTIQHAAQQALKDAKEQLQRAVQAGGVGLWDWDLRTDRVHYSLEWKRLVGYDEHELSDDPREWEGDLHPEDRDRVVQTVRDYIDGGGPTLDHEFRLRHKDGTYRHILARWAKMFDNAGVPVRVVGSQVDITARVELEAQLLQSQKMETVGRLAGGIAHDFNNLLTVINGAADLALGALRDGDPLRADLDQIRQAGDRAASLTRQLLAFSRKQILAPVVFSLPALVNGMESLLLRLLGENVRLIVPPSTSTGAVLADPGQIEQVVMNLAVNARDAMPGGGTLTIAVTDVDVHDAAANEHGSIAPGAYAVIAVNDTGTGMDEATRSRIFEPFFTTKEAGLGTGLGLSTVYGIVEQSGGGIRVASERGSGSTFSIYLPRSGQAAGTIAAPAAPATVAVGGAEHILIVEDEDALRLLASRILRSAGYTVHTAPAGAEALEALACHGNDIHLVLTDVVLPGMGGRELGALIGRDYPDIRVLYTSGYPGDGGARDGLGVDPDHFIGKPYTKAELTGRVRSMLDAPRF